MVEKDKTVFNWITKSNNLGIITYYFSDSATFHAVETFFFLASNFPNDTTF